MPFNSVTIAFGVLGTIAATLILLILPYHIKVRNAGILIMAFWAILGNSTQAITAFIFADYKTNFGEGILRWCDFAGAVQYIYPFGFTAGMFALLRKLENIASTREVSQTVKDRKKSLIIDIFLGLVCPVLLVPLRYIVQGHRSDVVIGMMCITPLYASVPALFLSQLPPLLLATTNAILAAIVLHWFILRRRQFSALLHSSGTGLTKRRYIRLMLLSFIEILITWPLNIYVFAYNIKYVAFQPYKSWNYVHEGFGKVYAIPYEGNSPATKAALEMGRWAGIVAGIVFFGFFGLSKQPWLESFTIIRKILQKVAVSWSLLRVKKVGFSGTKHGTPNLDNRTNTSQDIVQFSPMNAADKVFIYPSSQSTKEFVDDMELQEDQFKSLSNNVYISSERCTYSSDSAV